MKHVGRQQGMGVLGWIFAIAIVLFLALVGMKLVPNYINYFSVVKIMQNMAQDPELRDLPPRELKRIFMRRLDVNSIYDFPPTGFKVVRSREGKAFRVDYEVREPLVGNVDVVMHFRKEVKVAR